MPENNSPFDRRKFLQSSALLASTVAASGLMGFPFLASAAQGRVGTMASPNGPYVLTHPSTAPMLDGLYMIGPRDGYSPYIGSLVSMMNYNRSTIIALTKGMTMEQLDHLQDPTSNTIGALLMHLAAVDWYYNIHTFGDMKKVPKEEQDFWDPAMNLGDKGRQSIRGHELPYYVDLLTATREKTLTALKGKDDQWLLSEDPLYSNKETKFNYYWEWFHVCEHESHHRGQMAWLKKRVPGIKAGDD